MKLLYLLASAALVCASPIANPESNPEANPESDPDSNLALKMNSRSPNLDSRINWLYLKANPERDDGIGQTLKCRFGPGRDMTYDEYYYQGMSLKVACETIGEEINGQNKWLKVDPGPTLPWCYVSAYYTNYMDSSVPVADWCD